MRQDGERRRVYSTQLLRTRETPVRFALSTLVLSHQFWAGLVIGLPLVTLLAARSHHAFVPFAGGVPVVICLFLQMMSHEFVCPRLVVDPTSRTIETSKPYGLGPYQPIDVDEIERVSIVPIRGIAIVRLRYYGMAFAKPLSAGIAATDVPDVERRLERMGLDVTVREPDPAPMSIDAVRTRIVATPIAVFGSLIAVWQMFGPGAFVTNAVVVPVLVMAGLAAYSFWWRRRLRRSDRQHVGRGDRS